MTNETGATITVQGNRLDEVFSAVDDMDTGRFVRYLAPGAEFRFGSAPAVRGRDAISAAVDAFFATIAGLQHNLTSVISEDGKLACEGEVTYTRQDQTTLTVPFANIFDIDRGGLISGYRIYIDVGPLYADSG